MRHAHSGCFSDQLQSAAVALTESQQVTLSAFGQFWPVLNPLSYLLQADRLLARRQLVLHHQLVLQQSLHSLVTDHDLPERWSWLARELPECSFHSLAQLFQLTQSVLERDVQLISTPQAQLLLKQFSRALTDLLIGLLYGRRSHLLNQTDLSAHGHLLKLAQATIQLYSLVNSHELVRAGHCLLPAEWLSGYQLTVSELTSTQEQPLAARRLLSKSLLNQQTTIFEQLKLELALIKPPDLSRFAERFRQVVATQLEQASQDRWLYGDLWPAKGMVPAQKPALSWLSRLFRQGAAN